MNNTLPKKRLGVTVIQRYARGMHALARSLVTVYSVITLAAYSHRKVSKAEAVIYAKGIRL